MRKQSRVSHWRALGFDESAHIPGTRQWRIKCSCCEALVINGVPCHETGCTNAVHECHGCNALVPARQRYCEECAS